MRKFAMKLLLKTLNSRFLNSSPCAYGYIGNVDAFSAEHLEYEDKARPGITVRTVLDEAVLFKTCPLRPAGITVIEDGVAREGTIWDEHELRSQFTSAAKILILALFLTASCLGQTKFASNGNSPYLSTEDRTELQTDANAYYHATDPKAKIQALKTWKGAQARIEHENPGYRISRAQLTLVPITAPKGQHP